ncbi:SMP-30/gluconolactonase/LRE family protein [Lederbergia wuyishanensis]|uniref:Sugar lactone lactonase YvrE n=1 Tax=Lederbergia wuyishanensis TaxID=1347903 RepID=A0ABU0CZ49_9BACI|nr:SMP-30/gluconolactonase/LRE family protein [Lederbergia wuyishanensis]MCJ8006063.1 SMP-30/gluconolactonase/LRE family protein [Lederbergia wuyishanensis]MDQ0341432.1 sugar lactone lactonase YvrE [Lederbergia wuyishanensis]
MSYEVELILDVKAELGEGPSWEADSNVLYWVDILGKCIYTYEPATGKTGKIQLEEHVGAVVPKKGGGLAVVLQSGFYEIDLPSEKLTAIADPEEHLPNNRFNDGKCDPKGRFWAGTMPYDGEKGRGNFYVLEPNGQVKKVLDNITCSNGIAWNPDFTSMYYIDTPTMQVAAFDYDLETGEISNRRVAVQIPGGMGAPDGMTSDVEGNLWVAHWGGYRVTIWNPNTGEMLDSIPVPAPQVTSCVFGGENMDELYITTARTGLSREILEKYPHAGSLFRVKTNTKGSSTYKFGN